MGVYKPTNITGGPHITIRSDTSNVVSRSSIFLDRSSIFRSCWVTPVTAASRKFGGWWVPLQVPPFLLMFFGEKVGESKSNLSFDMIWSTFWFFWDIFGGITRLWTKLVRKSVVGPWVLVSIMFVRGFNPSHRILVIGGSSCRAEKRGLGIQLSMTKKQVLVGGAITILKNDGVRQWEGLSLFYHGK